VLTTRRAVCLLALLLVAPLDRPRTTAVLDRFEGDRAVLVTDDGATLVVARDRVPREGRSVDAVLRVASAHGTVTTLRYDAVATRQRRREARARFDRLAGPRPDANATSDAQH
jgi:hypothetical protein